MRSDSKSGGTFMLLRRGLAFIGITLLPLVAPLPAQDASNATVIGELIVHDPLFTRLIDPQAKIEVIVSGLKWSEGPLWVPEQNGPGYLLFSDIPDNSILKWVEGKGASVYLKPSGYTGLGKYSSLPGSNGLALDRQGRLILCEHGDRRVSLLAAGDGKRTLADNYQGKRFNSPNDAVVKSNGDIYFTDPPYGLPKQLGDPKCELGFSGVYRLSTDGQVTLLTRELTRPNGIAFSPDEKILYVPQTDPQQAVLMAYPVQEDGTLGTGSVLYDFTAEIPNFPGRPDGMEVDRLGNIFCTGPGGITVLTSEGQRLGRISTGEKISNCTFGGLDRSVLYFTSHRDVCRLQTKTSK